MWEFKVRVHKPLLHYKKLCDSNRRIFSSILMKNIIPMKLFRLHRSPDKQSLSYSEW